MSQLARTASPLLLLALTLGAAGAAAAQEAAPAKSFEGRIEVTEVLLDVLVTDNRGNLVKGLDKDDFVVEVGGNPVELTGVSFYTTRYGDETAVAPASGEVPASRYFIFFFDDPRRYASPLNQLMRQRLRAFQQSRQWVEETMGPSDWVAVASYDVKLKIHSDFTQDQAALLAALENAERGIDPEGDRELRRRRESLATAPSLTEHLAKGKALRKQTRTTYDGLRLLAEATGHIVGRKNLLLFSIGFGEIDSFQLIALPDKRYYPAMEQALNDNNVAVYAMDLTPVDSEHAQADFLNTLAHDTGGYYFKYFTSFLTPLRRIAEESTGYYLLSYTAEHAAGETGYQKISIRTRDGDLKVRAPRGYRYGEPPARSG